MAKESKAVKIDRQTPGLSRKGGSWTVDKDGKFTPGPKRGKQAKPKRKSED